MEFSSEQSPVRETGTELVFVPADARARAASKAPGARCVSEGGKPACPNLAERLDAYIRAVQDRLSPERFHHVLGVCHASLVLAGLQGLDTTSAALASLLHDLAKETPPEELRADMDRRRRPVGPRDEAFPKLWHALAAAVWAEQDFGVAAPDVLEAIRLHPTGDGAMSPLAQVVFVADFTDPTRDWGQVEDLRRAARVDFPRALALAIRGKLDHVRSRGYTIHPRALRALEAYGRRDDSLLEEDAYDPIRHCRVRTVRLDSGPIGR